MVKHISKIIEETELYKELQERKHDIGYHERILITDEIYRKLPGISEVDLIEKALFQPVSGVVSEREHKKSTEKPRSNE